MNLAEDLRVGVTIEKIDLVDINKSLFAVDNDDITLACQTLLRGYRNHLRSFVSSLEKQMDIYVPQYMTVADYQAIESTAIVR